MAMGMTLGAKRQGAQPIMNVTPLVDVVLVLLIIFMVVAPLLSKNFWLEVPKVEKTTNPPPADSRNIVVSIDAQGTVRINSMIVTKDDLKPRLSAILAERTDKVVYFNAAGDLPYADVVEVLDKARSGGAATIAVVSTELELPK